MLKIKKVIRKYKINKLNRKLGKEIEILDSLNEYKKICQKQIKNEQYYYIHTDMYKRNYDYCIDDIRITKEKILKIKKRLADLVEKI